MASTAISAQGSTLQIGTGSGSAKSISGVAESYPTILTSAAHGLANGNVVAIAGLTGADAALLNGLSFVVTNVTTNTFAVKVDTTGKTVTAGGGTATPTTYTNISNVKTFTGFDGSASELDKTNLQSTAKEFMLGLVDPGHFTITFDNDQNDAGQSSLRTAQVAGSAQNFKLSLPSGNTASFVGYVKTFTTDGGVDKVVGAQSQIRISGAVTWS